MNCFGTYRVRQSAQADNHSDPPTRANSGSFSIINPFPQEAFMDTQLSFDPANALPLADLNAISVKRLKRVDPFP